MITFQELKKRFSLMFSLDLRSLALARVFFGAILLFDLIDRARYLNTFYTDFGVFPRSVFLDYYKNSWFISTHLISGAWQFQALLFFIAAIFAVMLLLGYRTKLATIVSWFLLMSLQTRNPLILQGGDVLMRLGLFWAMFLPWGKYFSIDSVIKLNKKLEDKKINNFYFSGSSIAYILQIAFLYWFAAMFKTGNDWLKDGSAVYYALSIDQFATHFGSFLLHFPLLLKALTFSTLVVEAIFPFFFFVPVLSEIFRLIGALSFISLHTGFMLSMHLGPFPFVGMATATILLPGLFWKKIENFFNNRKKSHITIYYDNGCGFCTKFINIIRVFLIIPAKKIIPASKNPAIFSTMMKKNSWVVIDTNGKQKFKFEAFKAIASASPILFFVVPIFNVSKISQIGNTIYEEIAKHNKKQCFPLKKEKPKEKKSYAKLQKIASISASVISVVLIVYIGIWNIAELRPDVVPNIPLKFIGLSLRLDQRWNMFAPRPTREDGWYVISGELANGETVDVFKNGAPVSFDKPKKVSATYDGERWRKYLTNLWNKSYADYRLYYGQYICRSWNQSHSRDQQLMTFDIIYVLELTLPNYQESTPTPTTIWQHHCF